jgi:hypothetical protein
MYDDDTLSLVSFESGTWHEVARSQKNSFESLTAAKTLLEGDSGKTYFLNAAGGFTVTLPSPVKGLKFTFIVQTAPTTAYIVKLPTANATLFGVAIDINATAIGTVEDQINFVAATSVVGDRAEFCCDGTNWYAYTYSGASGGITFTT